MVNFAVLVIYKNGKNSLTHYFYRTSIALKRAIPYKWHNVKEVTIYE